MISLEEFYYRQFADLQMKVRAMPLNLGGSSGADGGSGGPPGGFIGKLPQSRIAFDTTEAEDDSLPITISGSLLDNLDRIRARIAAIEVGSGVGGGHVIYDDGVPFAQRANMNFIGAGVTIVDNESTNSTDITITGGSGTGTSDHTELLNLNTTNYYHLTQANHTDLTDSGESALHYHNSDRNRANHTGTQAESTLTFTDITDGNASTSKHGFLPKLPNDASQFLNGAGSWVTVSGGVGGGHVIRDDDEAFTNRSNLVLAGESFKVTDSSSTDSTIVEIGTLTSYASNILYPRNAFDSTYGTAYQLLESLGSSYKEEIQDIQYQATNHYCDFVTAPLDGMVLTSGTWNFGFYCFEDDNAYQSKISVSVYKRSALGADTLLFDSSQGTIYRPTIDPGLVQFTGNCGEVTINLGERLFFELYIQNGRTDSMDSWVKLYFDGDYPSYMQLPRYKVVGIKQGHDISYNNTYLPIRSRINFGGNLTVVDNGTSDSIDVTYSGGGHTIYANDDEMPARSKLRFSGPYVAVTDNSAEDSTDILMSGYIRMSEDKTSLCDGVLNYFPTDYEISSNSVMVFLNGLLQREGESNDYTVTASGITMVDTPINGDTLVISYLQNSIMDAVSGGSGSSLEYPRSPHESPVPALSSWSWINQASATAVTESEGGIYLHSPQDTGSEFNALVIPLTQTTNYKLTALILADVEWDYNRAGLLIYDSSSTHAITFNLATGDYQQARVASDYWNSYNQWAGQNFTGYRNTGSKCWFQIEDNDEDWIFRISRDGTHFVEVGTVTSLWHVENPDRIGFFACSENNTYGASAWLRSWKLEYL